MIDFVDIESALVAYLSSETGLPVSTRVPDPRPAQWIQVRRQGGSAATFQASISDVFRDKPLVDVFVWGEFEDPVWVTTKLVRALMLNLIFEQPFTATCDSVTEFMGPTWQDDLAVGMPATPKIWMSYEISTRIKEL